MAFEKRDMSGALFKNDRKETENHPDYTGDVLVNGTSFWINGWKKQDRNGNSFLSLSFKPKDQMRPASKSAPASPGKTADDPRTVRRELDDDLVF
jgi:uncharacterized protein (DUF736 family)